VTDEVSPLAGLDTGRISVAWLAGATLVGATECALLGAQSVPLGQALLLLPLLVGNLLPYHFVALVLFLGIAWAEGRVSSRVRRAPLVVAATVGLLVVPYSIWLARFTYSGEKASTFEYHSLLVAVTAVALSSGFAFLAWLFCLRGKQHRLRGLFGASLAVTSVVALWLSHAILPDEYEPLHAFVGIVAILLATLAGDELGRASGALGRRRYTPVALGVLGIVWAIASGLVLGHSEELAWHVWLRTPASRYVTRRWILFEPTVGEEPSAAPLVAKPKFDGKRWAHWRKRQAEHAAPHIIVFSLDGVLPNHLGAYGYHRHPTSVHIDKLAEEGALFTRAYSSYPITRNFATSFLLGRFIPEFSAHNPPRAYQRWAFTKLLKKRGYHILIESWFEFSARRDFKPEVYDIDTYVPPATRKQKLEATRMPYVPQEQHFEQVIRHLDQARAKNLPVFLWTHLLGTHPFKGGFTPSDAHDFGPAETDHYDSAIAGGDDWFKRLQDSIAERFGDSRPTFWIFCSDHGIALGDNPASLTERARAPLIIAGPGIARRRIETPADISLDLAATVLDIAGIRVPQEYDGISLAPLLLEGDAVPELMSRVIVLQRRDMRGAVYRPWHYLEYRGSQSLFDFQKDPGQTLNLAGQRPGLVRRLSEFVGSELERRARAFREGRQPQRSRGKRRGSRKRSSPRSAAP
jgi:arylsulfatase A-like enzyme